MGRFLETFLGFCTLGANGFYLPGVSPREYEELAEVSLKVNKLTSAKTQLPMKFYDLPYCQPEGGIKDSAENLGEHLTGDVIENSAFDIHMKMDAQCKVLCQMTLTERQKNKFRTMIDDEYMVNWIVDNLPASTPYQIAGSPETRYIPGFPVGLNERGYYYVYNHVGIVLKYHANPEKYSGFRIVGFEVTPASILQATQSAPDEPSGFTAICQMDQPLKRFDVDKHNDIVFTYDVQWVYSETRWASRWDSYLKMTGGQIHWFSIMNSLLIMLLLSAMIATILVRTLARDITKYNELTTAEEKEEETGWKLVHGDVFRKPEHAKLLCCAVGSGVQLMGMAIVTLFFALLGLLSPSNRGALLQSMMLLFTIMGCAAGYVAARLYKLFGQDDWKTMTLLVAFLFPGVVFVIFLFLNGLIWGQNSSGAVPFTTLFALLVLWFGMSVPLVFLGSYRGYTKDAIEVPVRTCKVPRAIKEQEWYMHPVVSALVSGLLPFGAVFTELYFIMSSIWQHQFYYLFGFVALVMVILAVTCAEVSIAMTYFQLTSENYHWWWRSFFYSGTSGVYVYLYSAMYFGTSLNIDKFVSTLLFFGYMGIASLAFALLTGSIGILSTFFFVRSIYGSVKVD